MAANKRLANGGEGKDSVLMGDEGGEEREVETKEGGMLDNLEGSGRRLIPGQAIFAGLHEHPTIPHAIRQAKEVILRTYSKLMGFHTHAVCTTPST